MIDTAASSSSYRYPSLEGRNAIITGGGRGLGRVMAEALIGQGTNVMITGARVTAELEETAAQLNAIGGGRCIGMAADVSDPDACESVVRATQDAFGSIDVLVNNAGRGPMESMDEAGREAHLKHIREGLKTTQDQKHDRRGDRFWEGTVDGYLRMVLTNLAGPFLMARLVTPGMIERGFGRIVNISTSRLTMTHTGFGPYGALKAALEASTRMWAAELEGTGVTANVLLPGGATDTASIPGGVPGKRAKPYVAGSEPRGQEANVSGLLPPSIMGPPILWLASDDSNGVNGRRFNARDWGESMPPAEAARRAEADRIDVPHII